MKTQQGSTIRKTWVTVLLFLTLLSSVATPAAATPLTPYDIFIENPGVWSIAGFFESDTDTWFIAADITNWSFTATTPTFTVGPFTMQQMNTTLITFAGSTSTGIRNVNIRTAGIATAIIFEVFPNLPSPIYNVRIAEPGKGVLFDQGDPANITNTATVVPEPATALSFVTGLLGLAGIRWQQRSRERTQVGRPTFSPQRG